TSRRLLRLPMAPLTMATLPHPTRLPRPVLRSLHAPCVGSTASCAIASAATAAATEPSARTGSAVRGARRQHLAREASASTRLDARRPPWPRHAGVAAATATWSGAGIRQAIPHRAPVLRLPDVARA